MQTTSSSFKGRAAFERLLTGSENGVEFRLDQIAGKYDLTDDTQRIAYAQEVSEELASWRTPWSGRYTPPVPLRRRA